MVPFYFPASHSRPPSAQNKLILGGDGKTRKGAWGGRGCREEEIRGAGAKTSAKADDRNPHLPEEPT